MLAYQPELGLPWFELRGVPFYRPWALFGWWFHYEVYAPAVFNKAGALAAANGFLGCGAAVAGSLWRARQSGAVTTYGSAHWASAKDARAAGLLGEAGLFLGSLGGADLRHDGPEHAYCRPYGNCLSGPDHRFLARARTPEIPQGRGTRR